MKFLIHGNAPWVPTGYGVQAALLGPRLAAAGHEVAFSSTYGLGGSIQSWRGFRVYPCGYEVNSNDLIHHHAAHWFEDTPAKDCWIILIIDMPAMVTPRLADFNVIAWTPIDRFPIPPATLQFFDRSQAVPVAMAKYGERLMFDQGLDPGYIPLSVDTKVFKPTAGIAGMTAREFIQVPEDAFVVGMFAMNKGWAKDRKGFNEAFWAFGKFLKSHPDAVLYMHSEKYGGAEGINLTELAVHAGIPDANIVWAGGEGQYAYRVGFTPEMLAASYSACDVLLSPSHGEGFCVPLIEAQACGVPVIANDFSAQSELVGAGWVLLGQPEWDPAWHACLVNPLIDDVVEKLELAYERASDPELRQLAIRWAGQFDSDLVFDEFWRPFIDQLAWEALPVPLERDPMPDEDAVDVLVAFRRPQNARLLIESFMETTDPAVASLVLVCDDKETAGFLDELCEEHDFGSRVRVLLDEGAVTYAQKMNRALEDSSAPWVLLAGDDVRFHPGWLDAARPLSRRYDVIGTNDTAGKVKNPKVASGGHADHYFVRRRYIDEVGASLEGPGSLVPECYRHWYTDMEVVGLAKARGVFAPCLASVVEHLHPGYDGREDLRAADATYMEAVSASETDKATYMGRLPLIEMQRTTKARVT